jgi:hypothetical protein
MKEDLRHPGPIQPIKARCLRALVLYNFRGVKELHSNDDELQLNARTRQPRYAQMYSSNSEYTEEK